MSPLFGLRIISSPNAVKPVTIQKAKRVTFAGGRFSCRKPRVYWMLRPDTVMEPCSYFCDGVVVMHPDLYAEFRKRGYVV